MTTIAAVAAEIGTAAGQLAAKVTTGRLDALPSVELGEIASLYRRMFDWHDILTTYANAAPPDPPPPPAAPTEPRGFPLAVALARAIRGWKSPDA